MPRGWEQRSLFSFVVIFIRVLHFPFKVGSCPVLLDPQLDAQPCAGLRPMAWCKVIVMVCQQLLQCYVGCQCECISLHNNLSAFSSSPPLFYLWTMSICRVESVELWLRITEMFQLHISLPAFMLPFGFFFLFGFFFFNRENVGSLFWLPGRPRKSLCERSDETTSRRRRGSCEGLCQCSE